MKVWKLLLHVLLPSAVLVLLILSVVASVRRGRRPGWWKPVALATALALVLSVLWAFPIENLFLTFPDAASVFHYACDGKLIGIVDGEASSFILYETGPDSHSHMLAPKTDTGYKIGSFRSADLVANYMGGGATLSIFRDPTGRDYYASLMGFVHDTEVSVTDDLGTEFHTSVREMPRFQGQTTVLILGYARVEGYTDQYRAFVNGEEMVPLELLAAGKGNVSPVIREEQFSRHP